VKYKRYTLDGTPLSADDVPALRALRGETVRDFRYKLVTPGGKETTISVSSSPVLDSIGRVIGAANVFRDIGDIIEFERQKDELYEREHHIARVLQDAILPPEIAENILGCTIAVKYRPALREAEIGGDFYDVFQLDDAKFAILIGDIAGKGLPAAIRVAATRHAIRSYAYIEPNAGRVLELSNEALCRVEGPEEVNMLTAIYAVADLDSGTLSYAIAGHEPPVILSPDGTCDELKHGGIPMGVIQGITFPQLSYRIKAGDTLVMVTDGITEARAPGKPLFGRKRMIELLQKTHGASLDGLAISLIDAATAHAGGRLHDDAAIVAIRYGSTKP
jgi:sigma-B regulation protein RsbU (phosphoserine phosphatase)